MGDQGSPDRLFLTWNCPDCIAIREELSDGMIYDDDVVGDHGHPFVLIYTFSNRSATDSLAAYGLSGYFTPVLVTHEGSKLVRRKQIIAHLRKYYEEARLRGRG